MSNISGRVYYRYSKAFCTAIGIILVATANAQTAGDYYPLSVGSRWVYTSVDNSGAAEKPVRLVRTAIPNPDDRNSVLFKTEDSRNDRPMYNNYAKDDEGNVVWLSMGVSPTMVLIDFDPPYTMVPHDPVDIGKSWEWIWKEHSDEYPDSVFIRIDLLTVMSTHETVTVPAGTFHNCIKIRLININNEGEVQSILHWFYAKGVGEVLSINESSDGKKIRNELIEYSIVR